MNLLTRLVYKGIVMGDNSDEAAIVILKEHDGERELPISVSKSVAEKIASSFANEKNLLPDIYDSFNEFLGKTLYKLDHACIFKYEYGIFYSYLTFEDGVGEQMYIDNVRPSDALILTIQNNSLIYCEKSVLDEAGFDINRAFFTTDAAEFSQQSQKIKSEDVLIDEFGNAEKLSLLSIDELNIRMDIAIRNEDYQYAAKLRDARNKKL